MGPASGATRYVDGAVSSSGDGTSWTTAFKTIQEGIDASSEADIVIVAEGTYFENIKFNGVNIVLMSADPRTASAVIDGRRAGPTVTFSGTEAAGCLLSGFIVRNGSAAYGGGILGGDYPHFTHATIRNNTITGNVATYDGGGVSNCAGIIENNTITGNAAGDWGSGVAWCDSATRNCILWGNSSATGIQIKYSSVPTYSCVQDWSGGGEGNIAEDPQFVDPDGADNDPATQEDNDYRLTPASPCIDTGTNEVWMGAASDQDGNPRVWRGASSWTVDMGAYEFGSFSFQIVNVEKTAIGQPRLTWNSRPDDEYVIWFTPDLTSGVWTSQPVTSAGNSTSWTDANPGVSRKFYRVELPEMHLD